MVDLQEEKDTVAALINEEMEEIKILPKFERERREKDLGEKIAKYFMNKRLDLSDKEEDELMQHIKLQFSKKGLKEAAHSFKSNIIVDWSAQGHSTVQNSPKGREIYVGIDYSKYPWLKKWGSFGSSTFLTWWPGKKVGLNQAFNIYGFSTTFSTNLNRPLYGLDFGGFNIAYSKDYFGLSFGGLPLVPFDKWLLVIASLKNLAEGNTPAKIAKEFSLSLQDLLVVDLFGSLGVDFSSTLYKADTDALMKKLKENPNNKTLIKALQKREDVPVSFLAFMDNCREALANQRYRFFAVASEVVTGKIKKKIIDTVNYLEEVSNDIDKLNTREAMYATSYLIHKIDSPAYGTNKVFVRFLRDNMHLLISNYYILLHNQIEQIKRNENISSDDKIKLYDLFNILNGLFENYNYYKAIEHSVKEIGLDEKEISNILLSAQKLIMYKVDIETLNNIANKLESEPIEPYIFISKGEQFKRAEKVINPDLIELCQRINKFEDYKEIRETFGIEESNIKERLLGKISNTLLSAKDDILKEIDELANKKEISNSNYIMLLSYKAVLNVLDSILTDEKDKSLISGYHTNLENTLADYEYYQALDILLKSEYFFSPENTDDKNKEWLKSFVVFTEPLHSSNENVRKQIKKKEAELVKKLLIAMTEKDGFELYEKYTDWVEQQYFTETQKKIYLPRFIDLIDETKDKEFYPEFVQFHKIKSKIESKIEQMKMNSSEAYDVQKVSKELYRMIRLPNLDSDLERLLVLWTCHQLMDLDENLFTKFKEISKIDKKEKIKAN